MCAALALVSAVTSFAVRSRPGAAVSLAFAFAPVVLGTFGLTGTNVYGLEEFHLRSGMASGVKFIFSLPQAWVGLAANAVTVLISFSRNHAKSSLKKMS